MPDDPGEPEKDTEYYSLPEEALQFFPDEWRQSFQTMADNGRAALDAAEKELLQLYRISNSFTALVALKHAQKRLSEYKFDTDMNAIMELDMLTTAFVVAYVRLHEGGKGSGFGRDILPEHLRSVHDEIIQARNKRFAHNDDHHSFSNNIGFEFDGSRFFVKFGLSLGYHIGGRTEWRELVSFLDQYTVERMEKVLARLKRKTGHEWMMPRGPAPD
ncbi:hypothetical protein [Bradyrhizobium sp. SZCCHNPS1003]|uniref:hypothetical protein n=1 Tax=Bradyrhizobium sp. SZCCHNPS1003 TaxID=3057330 RepID=UPI0028E2BB49|nr:hypothetical protein [Bradyrhizobium sp. SZCCHNPS1003]